MFSEAAAHYISTISDNDSALLLLLDVLAECIIIFHSFLMDTRVFKVVLC